MKKPVTLEDIERAKAMARRDAGKTDRKSRCNYGYAMRSLGQLVREFVKQQERGIA